MKTTMSRFNSRLQVVKTRAGLVAAATVLTTSLIGGVFTGTASAGYLDGEITYEGTIAMSNGLDAEDGTADGICHDDTEDPTSAVVTCGMKGDDYYSDPIDIGFNFEYYGDTFDTVYANINGMLSFDCPNSTYSNETLPSTFDGECSDGDPGIVPSAIMPFWDDIITAPRSLYCADETPAEDGSCAEWDWDGNYPTVVYKTIGDPGSRKFIVQWTNMYLYSDPNVPMGTFQVILYEGSNNIQMQYRNLLGNMERSTGSDATIGIQKNSTTANQFSSDTVDSIQPGTVIRYTPNGSGDYNDADTAAAYEPVYLSIPGAPGKPVATRPTNGATDVARQTILEWNAATDADNYIVTLATDSDFSNIVFREDGLTDTSYTSSVVFEENTTYYWTVKATNDMGETFSDIFTFTTGTTVEDTPSGDADTDTDGAVESIEMAAPNDGDVNEDNIPDNTQTNVTSVINPVTGKYTTLVSSGCDSNSNVSAFASSVKDGDYSYPAGLAKFNLACPSPGTSATITIYFFGVEPTNMVLRKYNETTHTYKNVQGATLTSVTVGGQQATKAVYSVTDGGELDADGAVNGTIVDPAGLAFAGSPNTGLTSTSLITPITTLVTGLGLAYIARRKSDI